MKIRQRLNILPLPPDDEVRLARPVALLPVFKAKTVRTNERRRERLFNRPVFPGVVDEQGRDHAGVAVRLAVGIDLRHAVENLLRVEALRPGLGGKGRRDHERAREER
jgi:hypothetical protein